MGKCWTVINLTDKQINVVESIGHVLVTGGPGSGKTTTAILKAAKIAQELLYPEQKVLFLSFARATIARVMEAIEHEQRIPPEQKKLIKVETYHSFFWRIIRSQGYLIGLPRRILVLTPQNEAVMLSGIRSEYKENSSLSGEEKDKKLKCENQEKIRLAMEEGRVSFDLFAKFTSEILCGSQRIRKLISSMYPFIILDEFQDTNEEQWNVIKIIGLNSTLIALADPEQRIYDFAGASPKRLEQFKEEFNPTVFDLGTENHRSNGTEIVMFGNDIVKGEFRQKSYKGIIYYPYEPNENQALSTLIIHTLSARKRLEKSLSNNWSLSILVPTKRMTRMVSDAFNSPPAKLPAIPHHAVFDMGAVILAAEIIAFLMQLNQDNAKFSRFIELVCNYFKGKYGDTPTKGALQEAERIRNAFERDFPALTAGRSISTNSILRKIYEVYQSTQKVTLSGKPDQDWKAIRDILEHGVCPRLQEIAREVRNLRLLGRGDQLRHALAQDWLSNGQYINALEIVRRSFIQEHFAIAQQPTTGIIIMNMHKAKGKQFDEVIIFEGWPRVIRGRIVSNPDRIVKNNNPEKISPQERYTLRVSITRAKKQTTILTPKNDPCILLFSNRAEK